MLAVPVVVAKAAAVTVTGFDFVVGIEIDDDDFFGLPSARVTALDAQGASEAAMATALWSTSSFNFSDAIVWGCLGVAVARVSVACMFAASAFEF